MSNFLGFTPTVQIRIENPLLGRTFPAVGVALAVIDTGYEGFLSIPREIFREVWLDQLRLTKRTLLLADGGSLSSEGAHATLVIPDIEFRANGFVESYDGLDEIILGTGALRYFSLVLDYCTNTTKLESCS